MPPAGRSRPRGGLGSHRSGGASPAVEGGSRLVGPWTRDAPGGAGFSAGLAASWGAGFAFGSATGLLTGAAGGCGAAAVSPRAAALRYHSAAIAGSGRMPRTLILLRKIGSYVMPRSVIALALL